MYVSLYKKRVQRLGIKFSTVGEEEFPTKGSRSLLKCVCLCECFFFDRWTAQRSE